MKQKNSSRSSTAAGMVISSVRSTPRARRGRPESAMSPAGSRADRAASAAGTAMTDPRVEHVVEQVGGQVGEDDDRGEGQHDSLDERDIPVVDGLEQLESDAGHPEDLFHDHRRPDERGQVEPDDRDQADERVPQRVPGQDRKSTRLNSSHLGTSYAV